MGKGAFEPSKVEYRVRKIERYIVTRYEAGENFAGGGVKGEYPNEEIAHEVAYALCKAEHERLGWPVGDERIQYPRSLDSAAATPE